MQPIGIYNIFWNADDICLLAPTIRAVQKMINVCFDYTKEHNITFNPLKLFARYLSQRIVQLVLVMFAWIVISSIG